MKKLILLCILSLVGLAINCQAKTPTLEQSQLKLWYTQPATQWVEALPIGNGRLGAMVFGNPDKEVIQLNESTVWAGSPSRNDSPQAKEALPLVRKLIFEGRYKEAQDVVNQKFFAHNSDGMPYQTVGNLELTFADKTPYSNYRRELNLGNATVSSSYERGGVNYKTTVFASYPDQVIVTQISADRTGAINFSATLNRPSKVEVSTIGNNELVMSGVTSGFEKVSAGVPFEAKIRIVTKGGIVSANGNALEVKGAEVATIYISIASGFKNYNDISGDAKKLADGYLQKATQKSYNNILKEHVADYQKYFNRVALNLGTTEAAKNPTDKRVEQFAKGDDPQMVELYFQFGRYLLISSSRPGGQPANLQGIWNDQLTPPWDSKYTVNINTEMNYWPSEITNLTEMNEPLVKMVGELAETGRQTARDMYGARGWVLHHNTDIWRINGPVDGAFWGMWPMGGAWLSKHLFDKYEYGGDKNYLASVYPVLREASRFYLDFLTEEPQNNWLVVSPSISPENAPSLHPDASIAAGTTMDNQLVFDLFTKTIEAATILGEDADMVAQMSATLKRLPPMQVGKWGQLQEWMFDWDNPKDRHRHVSHLYGLYPSNQISPWRTPQLFSAARTSLVARGDESTGWSMGWKVNLWARLLDGDHALKLISDQLSPAAQSQTGEHGGTYPNLFDAHPPFQIDGNFGCTSGIAEMLMQSHDGAINILPALPEKWKSGSVSGLRAVGGFEVSIEWRDNKPNKIVIKSNLGGNCRIRVSEDGLTLINSHLTTQLGENQNPFYKTVNTKEPIINASTKVEIANLKPTFLYDFPTKAGGVYTINCVK